MSSGENISAFTFKNHSNELQRINRITGLNFQSVPESLLGRQEEWEAFAESLLGIAMATWNREID